MNTILSSFLAAIIVAFSFSHAFSASSQWKDLGGGKIRMLAVKDPATDKITGLVEVYLDKGWKTYWKSPGGSGIPPEFDFSRSTKLTTSAVRFPVPSWIEFKGAKFFGYRNKIQFVFEADTFAPDATLNLDILIGVCKEICIPATAQLNLSAKALNSSDPRSDVLIELAKSNLPGNIEPASVETSFSQKGRNVNFSFKFVGDSIPTISVLELPEIWTSDPVTLKLNASSHYTATFKLPAKFSGELSDKPWKMNLIEMDGKTVTGVKELNGSPKLN